MHKAPVILTTFAGRRDRMSILVSYALEALRRGTVTQYHLWNYARNKTDQAWVSALRKLHPGIRVFQPQGVPYDAYYDHYLKAAYDDTVFIKADDDIVFIDLESLQAFIDHRAADQDTFLLSADVLNNGVCAYFQQQNGRLPSTFPQLPYPPEGFCGDLWESAPLATRLHDLFLASPSTFAGVGTTVAPDRLSINFISYLGRDLDHIAGVRGDDEQALSVTLPQSLHRVNRIYHPLMVSHLSFYSQEPDMDTGALLRRYRALAPPFPHPPQSLMLRWLPVAFRKHFLPPWDLEFGS